MPWYDDYRECWTEGGTLLQEFMNSRKALLNDGAYIRFLLEYGYVYTFMHKTYQKCAHICNIYTMHIARAFLFIRPNSAVGLAKIY